MQQHSRLGPETRGPETQCPFIEKQQARADCVRPSRVPTSQNKKKGAKGERQRFRVSTSRLL